jgi:hypothetical protein
MLTKKRDLSRQVNSNGFALFVVGLTFAGFLGGAMRLFLNSERAQQKILTEVRKKFPEWNVKADKVELRLASGIWPGVTVELPQTHLFKEGNCSRPAFNVDMKDLKIPVGIWSLLRGTSRLGRISIAAIHVELAEGACERSASPQEPSTSSPSEGAEQALRLNHLNLRKVYEELSERASGLTVGELVVESAHSPDWSFRAQPLELDAGAQVRMAGRFSLWKEFSKGEVRQDFQLKAALQGPLLEWKLSSTMKEGQLEWSGQLDDEGHTFLQKFRVSQGPLGDVLSLLHRAGVLEKLPETKRVWLNCALSQSGTFENLRSLWRMPVNLSSCGVDGELGRLVIQPQLFYLKEPYFRAGPLVVNVSKLSLDQLTDIISLPKMSVIFSHLGNWSGSLKLRALKDLELSGVLEDLRVKVSNKSLRGIEVLSKIQTEGHVTDEKMDVRLSDFQILGGSRGGDAHFVYDMEHRRGTFDVIFKGLKPSESIQSLLFEGRMEPLRLNVAGSLEQEKVTDLRADFSATETWGKGWHLTGIKGALNQLAAERFSLQWSARQFTWDGSFRYDGFASEVAGAFQHPLTKKELKDISVRAEIDAQGGLVKKASAQFLNRLVEFEGGWQRGEHLTGKARLGGKKPWVAVKVTPGSGQIIR